MGGRILISVGSPLQLLNALTAAHEISGDTGIDFTQVEIFFWPKRDNEWKNRQADAIAALFSLRTLQYVARWPDFRLRFGNRSVALSTRFPLIWAAIQGSYEARAVRAFRTSSEPEWIIGFGPWLRPAFVAWPGAKIVWVDGGASTLAMDFATLTQQVEKSGARRTMRRLGQRAFGAPPDNRPPLPSNTVLFSIYPRERIHLAGHPYRRNRNLLLERLYTGIPRSNDSIIASLNAGGYYTSRGGDIAPRYRAFLDYCRENARGRVYYFPRGNEPQWAADLIAERWKFERADPELPLEVWIPTTLGARPSMVFAGYSTAGDILYPYTSVDRYWPPEQ